MRIEAPFENPTETRITSSDGSGETQIVIPPARNAFAMIFFGVWLGGWTVGGVFAFNQFTNAGAGNRAFLGFWLCAWLIGEVFAIGNLLWMFFGREVLLATRSALEHSYVVFTWSKTKRYQPGSITNLRYIDGLLLPTRGGRQSCISFDYGPRTVSLAKGCDAGEASHIIEMLRRRLELKGEVLAR